MERALVGESASSSSSSSTASSTAHTKDIFKLFCIEEEVADYEAWQEVNMQSSSFFIRKESKEHRWCQPCPALVGTVSGINKYKDRAVHSVRRLPDRTNLLVRAAINRTSRYLASRKYSSQRTRPSSSSPSGGEDGGYVPEPETSSMGLGVATGEGETSSAAQVSSVRAGGQGQCSDSYTSLYSQHGASTLNDVDELRNSEEEQNTNANTRNLDSQEVKQEYVESVQSLWREFFDQQQKHSYPAWGAGGLPNTNLHSYAEMAWQQQWQTIAYQHYLQWFQDMMAQYYNDEGGTRETSCSNSVAESNPGPTMVDVAVGSSEDLSHGNTGEQGRLAAYLSRSSVVVDTRTQTPQGGDGDNDRSGAAGTLSDSQLTCQDSEGALHDSEGALHDSEGALHDSEGTCYKSKGICLDSQGTLCDSEGLFNLSGAVGDPNAHRVNVNDKQKQFIVNRDFEHLPGKCTGDSPIFETSAYHMNYLPGGAGDSGMEPVPMMRRPLHKLKPTRVDDGAVRNSDGYTCNIDGNTCNIDGNTCNIDSNTCDNIAVGMHHFYDEGENNMPLRPLEYESCALTSPDVSISDSSFDLDLPELPSQADDVLPTLETPVDDPQSFIIRTDTKITGFERVEEVSLGNVRCVESEDGVSPSSSGSEVSIDIDGSKNIYQLLGLSLQKLQKTSGTKHGERACRDRDHRVRPLSRLPLTLYTAGFCNALPFRNMSYTESICSFISSSCCSEETGSERGSASVGQGDDDGCMCGHWLRHVRGVATSDRIYCRHSKR